VATDFFLVVLFLSFLLPPLLGHPFLPFLFLVVDIYLVEVSYCCIVILLVCVVIMIGD